MKLFLKLAGLAVLALMAFGTPSYANNPLLGNSSHLTVLSDKEMASVKGSGSTAAYYGYYGALYGSYASLYAAYGTYYNYVYGTGSSSYATAYYYDAQYYAYYSYLNYYYAYYYSYYGY